MTGHGRARWHLCPTCGNTVYAREVVEDCDDHRPTMPEQRGGT